MNYTKELQKAKANRSDHRRARATPDSGFRRQLVRDSKKFKSVEREHDQARRFGGSLKSTYYDSNGDGYKDRYGKVYRGGVAGKNFEFPTSDPVDPPVSGPSGLTATENVPVSGPSGLTASQQIDPPISGPSGLTATEAIPVSGPSGLTASEAVPVSGPSGLTASENAPVSGPSGLTATEAIPVSGPSGLTATEAVPVSGPSGLTATKLTLNIAPLSTDQDALVATTPAVGTIKYSSDAERLFIYDGTDWHNYL